jgi:hypothetical protein
MATLDRYFDVPMFHRHDGAWVIGCRSRLIA